MPGTEALRSPTTFATVISSLWQGTIAAILTVSAFIPCPIVVRRSDPVRRSDDATGLRLGYGLRLTEREIATHPPLSMLRQRGPAHRPRWPRTARSGRGPIAVAAPPPQEVCAASRMPCYASIYDSGPWGACVPLSS